MAHPGWMNSNAPQSSTQSSKNHPSKQTIFHNTIPSIEQQQNQSYLIQEGPDTSVDLCQSLTDFSHPYLPPKCLNIAGGAQYHHNICIPPDLILDPSSSSSSTTRSQYWPDFETQLGPGSLGATTYLADFDFSDFILVPEDAGEDAHLSPELPLQQWPEPQPSTQSHHSCEHCGTSFSKRNKLEGPLHKRTKSFKCQQQGCDASFTEPRGLDRHLKSRHRFLVKEEDWIRCSFCTYAYTRADAVQRHMWKRHGVRVSFRLGGGSPPTMIFSE